MGVLSSVIILMIVVVGFALSSDKANRVLRPPSQAAAAAAPSSAFDGIELIGKAAIVIDIKTGKTLFALNPETQLPLASLTKIATVLAVSEVLRPDDLITIPYDVGPTGSAKRLTKGTTWRVQDFIDFTLIASSNEGAEILAATAEKKLHEKYPQSPASKATLWRMNDIARSLSLERTYFLNASGLDLSATQSGAYGSASDIAKLFAYALSDEPSVFAGTRKNDMTLTTSDGTGKTAAFNTNESQGEIPGLIMGKTGYTDLAGGNLAVVFDVGPAHPVVVVVLGSTREGRFEDINKLVTASQKAITAQ